MSGEEGAGDAEVTVDEEHRGPVEAEPADASTDGDQVAEGSDAADPAAEGSGAADPTDRSTGADGEGSGGSTGAADDDELAAALEEADLETDEEGSESDETEAAATDDPGSDGDGSDRGSVDDAAGREGDDTAGREGNDAAGLESDDAAGKEGPTGDEDVDLIDPKGRAETGDGGTEQRTAGEGSDEESGDNGPGGEPVEIRVPPNLLSAWRRRAETAKLSLSEYVVRMAEAGRMSVQMQPESVGGDAEAAMSLDQLEDEVVEMLRREGVVSWEGLVEAISRNLEEDLEEALARLQEEGEVRYSGLEGGYQLVEED